MDDHHRDSQEGSRKRRRLSYDETLSGPPHSTVATVATVASSSSSSTPTTTSHTMASSDTAPAPTETLKATQNSLETMRQILTCKVCHRLMHEPYALTCGHTYCYSCLTNWIAENRKKTCPDCRCVIAIQPSPSFVIREMVNLFASRVELLGEGETSEEHSQSAVEEATIIAKDKANEESGGLFRGAFRNGFNAHLVPMHDPSDGVDRCPQCFWEVEDGYCDSCGIPVGDGFSDFDGEDLVTEDDNTDEDDDDGFGEEAEGESASHLGPEEMIVRQALFGSRRRMRRAGNAVGGLTANGWRMQWAARHNAAQPASGTQGRPDDSDSDSSEFSEDDGSMDGFIAGDDEGNDDEESDSDIVQEISETENEDEDDDNQVSSAGAGPKRRVGRVVISDDDDEEDDGPGFGQSQRNTTSNSARSRIVLSSDEDDDDHDDDSSSDDQSSSSESDETEAEDDAIPIWGDSLSQPGNPYDEHDSDDDDIDEGHTMDASDVFDGESDGYDTQEDEDHYDVNSEGQEASSDY